MYASIWSLVPYLVVVPISLLTRQVLPGLFVGLVVGAYMLHPTWFGGVDATLSYILKELAIPDNLRLIVFLYGFGAFVGLVRVTGGVSGFARWMSTRIQSVRGAFAVTWLSAAATFMAPDFRIITVAPVMKQVFSRLHIPPEKVAFVIDVTSTPLCAVIPIGTAFVGYMVGLISTSARHYGIAGSPFRLFVSSIPLNLFAFLIMAYGLFTTFRPQRTVNPQEERQPVTQERRLSLPVDSRLRLASQRLRMETAGELTAQPTEHRNAEHRDDDVVDPVEVLSEHVPPKLVNLALPLLLLLALTLFLTWWDGHQRAPGLFPALAQANAAKAMLEALLMTLACSFVWYTVQRHPIQRTLFGFLAGGNEMMSVIVLLVLVWAVSAVSNDLGFTQYVERTIGHLVPSAFVAPALFLFGCALSYVIGSSFGAWGMLLPLGFSLAAGTHASVALIAGAVFASGTFGGFVSPLSDGTVAMATVMKMPLMRYARYKLKPALYVAGVSAVGYAVAGWILPG
ncbi:transporter [Alicyclobacillus contaminans]|uniref:Na+/H+ antiporter NhaC family protein n=1 Tax=Alicyclobacillus contaminans TaxID=392016 RepID=UPI0004237CE1|nr:Na+/H+ antiporter NhaC family protein [Alicyclobacillus contaminans]GMA51698.1 transporter [Alicyclobacillus contaminans]